jgi:glucose-1-phosphate adenylyltransferase
VQETERFISRLTKNTLGLILAGGRGSRLGALTEWNAKPAIDFGGKYRIIDFPLSNCLNSGIRQIGVLVQYKSQSLIQHIQRGWGFMRGQFNEFIDIMPAQQRTGKEDWYKGTADAVFQNIDLIRRYAPEYVLILAGDHVYKMDYGKMLAEHVQSGADMTVGCYEVKREEATAFGVMAVNAENRVIEFAEKPKDPKPIPGQADKALVSMGIYVFNRDFLIEQLVRDADDPKSSHDFGKNIIPYVISRYRVMAHRFGNSCVGQKPDYPYWRDVGTIDAFWEANLDLTHIIPDLDLYDKEWPIWTYQEQLPPCKFVFDDEGRRGMAVDSLVSGGCIISGAKVTRSLLFSDVHVHSYAEIEESVILPEVDIGRRCRLKKVVVDRECALPPDTVIGFNPEEDKKRFHVTEKGVILVTPSMLGQSYFFIR